MPKQPLHSVVLESSQARVSLLNYGAITREWLVLLHGRLSSVVLGYATPEAYLDDPFFKGIIAGRVANRTKAGRFSLNGQPVQLSQNEGKNHLHGGHFGLGRRYWQLEADGPTAARLSYTSPDGEEGYPGRVAFTVDIRLEGPRLTYDMQAVPKVPTPINLAQHNYYNLAGSGPIWGHELQVNTSHFTPTGPKSIPTGEVATLAGTPQDFRTPRPLITADSTLDSNQMTAPLRDKSQPLAMLSAPNGLRLKLWSDQPAIQIYTGGGLDVPNTGICLEPQFPPNALNQPEFGSIIATPEHPYRQVLQVEIGECP